MATNNEKCATQRVQARWEDALVAKVRLTRRESPGHRAEYADARRSLDEVGGLAAVRSLPEQAISQVMSGSARRVAVDDWTGVCLCRRCRATGAA